MTESGKPDDVEIAGESFANSESIGDFAVLVVGVPVEAAGVGCFAAKDLTKERTGDVWVKVKVDIPTVDLGTG